MQHGAAAGHSPHSHADRSPRVAHLSRVTLIRVALAHLVQDTLPTPLQWLRIGLGWTPMCREIDNDCLDALIMAANHNHISQEIFRPRFLEEANYHPHSRAVNMARPRYDDEGSGKQMQSLRA